MRYESLALKKFEDLSQQMYEGIINVITRLTSALDGVRGMLCALTPLLPTLIAEKVA